jgi:hypothetical protein
MDLLCRQVEGLGRQAVREGGGLTRCGHSVIGRRG